MKISEIAVMVLIVSGICMGFVSIYSDTAVKYNVTGYESTANNITAMSKMQQMVSFGDNLRNQTMKAQDQGWFGTVTNTVGLVWGAVIYVIMLPDILITLFTDGLKVVGFPIPDWFNMMIYGIILVIIIFKIIAWILGRENT